jgi:signal transduction histidine kinase
VTLFAEAGINLAQSGQHQRAGPLFTDTLQTGQQALKEMRLLVHRLRPSVLEEEGLVQALQHRLNAVEGRAGVKHQLLVKGKPDLGAEVEEALYYVVQEALNNALKHADAGEISVSIEQDARGALTLTIEDNGRGFDPQTAVNGSGLGLTSMRERIEKIGGAISYQSAIGKGTKVRIEIPEGANDG